MSERIRNAGAHIYRQREYNVHVQLRRLRLPIRRAEGCRADELRKKKILART